VIIAGASADLGDTMPGYNDRLILCSDVSLKEKDTLQQFMGEQITGPVYISIDKDVLDTGLPVTNWDNGTLPLSELKKILSFILKNHRVIGVDICGELTYSDNPLELLNCESLNNEINRELCNMIRKYL
jgi:hypothetical protein